MLYKQKKQVGIALFLVLVLVLATAACGGRQVSSTRIGQVASLTPITKVPTTGPAREIATEIPVVPKGSPVPPATATTVPTNSSALLPTATAATQPPTDITAPPRPTAAAVTALPTRVPPSATSALAILSFTVDVEDIATGKRLTFTWETTGASNVGIISGSSPYTPRTVVSWSGPPRGTLTVELEDTSYRNPGMTLLAYNDAGDSVIGSQTVHIEWPCKYEYFFLSTPPTTALCPANAPVVTVAAEQPFEHGRMIWLKEIHLINLSYTNVIFVLYDDQSPHLNRFEDQWTPAEPENDPAIVPPTGLYQPVRGFGKLWRENEGVRNRLGWALAREQSFEATWQAKRPVISAVGDVMYFQTLNGQIVTLWRWTSNSSGEWSEGADIK